ncbi:MoxR-like ATPase [Allocatelliglobosispora scoriae]|uniref:MoxR-like ATPase n=1 Tax=Allocatelliglobosispora scoriae TaxID=643052 RepID=A0A841BKU3_9ACTN|nr:MoxR family ATPase [Allocatelliglobosispora scoriae]MBB5867372.1 MoxR-like ATPase [Allocatelliglobosispora scoriae]
MTNPAGTDPAAYFAGVHAKLQANIARVLTGKADVIDSALTCLFAGGHLLLQDVPGVGKTTLAKALAASIDASCHRIQFTPDLLPSDITGTTVYDQRHATFEFRPGPVFAHIVIADEINRASPKTQSALLEVMQERQVTVDSLTYAVPEPFLVVATQNPIDLEGTYRLPEAQLDRFLFTLSVGYPDRADEQAILTGRAAAAAPTLTPVTSVDEVRWMIQYTSRIHVADGIAGYITDLVHATRIDTRLKLGASPRAGLALMRAAQARAAGKGRAFVVPDDVKAVAAPTLAHRLVLDPDAEVRRTRPEAVLADILAAVAVPVPASSR